MDSVAERDLRSDREGEPRPAPAADGPPSAPRRLGDAWIVAYLLTAAFGALAWVGFLAWAAVRLLRWLVA